MSSSAISGLLGLPYLARKAVVEYVGPAGLVSLCSEESIKNVLPKNKSAIIDISFINHKSTIMVTDEMGLQSEFGFSTDVFPIMQVYSSLFLRNVNIQLTNSTVSAHLNSLIATLGFFSFEKCETLRIFSKERWMPTSTSSLCFLLNKLSSDRIQLEMIPKTLPPTLPSSANWHFSMGDNLAEYQIAQLMRTAHSVTIDSSSFDDNKMHSLSKLWLQNDYKIKYMMMEASSDESLFSFLLQMAAGDEMGFQTKGVRYVRSGNGWIIRKENGDEARIERTPDHYIFTAL